MEKTTIKKRDCDRLSRFKGEGAKSSASQKKKGMVNPKRRGKTPRRRGLIIKKGSTTPRQNTERRGGKLIKRVNGGTMKEGSK